MTRRLWFKYAPTYCSEARGSYHSVQFWAPDMDWTGRTTGQRTVNLFARQTKKSVLNGLVLTFITILFKHPVKVHVWAGIGWHGATEICIFDWIMDAAMYVRIVQVALLPTLQRPSMRKVIVLSRRIIQSTPQE